MARGVRGTRQSLKTLRATREGLPCSRCGVNPRPATNSWCNKCMQDKAHVRDLREKFDITTREYTVLLATQNYRCAICHQPQKTKRLAVDHCHRTGQIRGLLCDKCNRGLPHFRNDAKVLGRAAEYMRLSLTPPFAPTA